MGESVNGSAARTPWHLWVVGGLSTLWNAFGCFDYVMTETRNEAYLSMATAAQRAYFETFPAWMVGAWAVGVWGALIGSLLLLMRSRHAVTAFSLSLLGLAVGSFYQFGMSNMPADMKTGMMLLIPLVIWLVAIGLLVYAMRMRRAGVLR
jgi:hypothetical protein